MPVKDLLELNEKHRLFCRYYLIEFNGTNAAIKAGYSKKTAASQASTLLRNPKIQTHIQELTAKVLKKPETLAARIVAELELVAFGRITDTTEWTGGALNIKPSSEVGDKSALIQEISESRTETSINLKIRHFDKLKALEMLGKYENLFKQEITIKKASELTDEELKAEARKLLGDT